MAIGDSYIVLYCDETMKPCDPPKGKQIIAIDSDKAEELFINMYPNYGVIWVSKAKTLQKAFDDYYNSPF